MSLNTKTQSRPKLLFLVPAISQTHKSLENSQDFLSRPRPRLYFFLSSRRLETKTLVSRTIHHCYTAIRRCIKLQFSLSLQFHDAAYACILIGLHCI